MLASLLDWPLACQVSKLELWGSEWFIERETSEGIESCQV